MAIEREFSLPVRLPEDVYEQKANIPDIETREKIAKSIFRGFSFLFALNGIVIDWEESGYRAKRIARIEDKILRRNSSEPERDIYGVRFVTEEEDRVKIANLIQSAYPLTPKEFPGGKLSVRDYRDASVRARHVEKFNPHMSPKYSALHVNFVFQRPGSGLLEIGEVQIMTHNELEVYKQTRDGYSNGHLSTERDQTSANS